MPTIIEVQAVLQNVKKEKITYTDIGNVLGSTRANISKRANTHSNLSETEIQKIEQFYNVNLSEVSPDNEPSIPGLYYPDVFGSCGNGAFVLSEQAERIQIPEKCFIKPINRCKTYSVINARSNSMQPTIYEKDKLIIEHFEPGETIQDNKIYVFCYDGQIMVKRLYYNVDEIIVKSDNPDPIFKVKYIGKENMKDLIIIGQIVGLWRDCR